MIKENNFLCYIGFQGGSGVSVEINIGMCFPDGCSNEDTVALVNTGLCNYYSNEDTIALVNTGLCSCYSNEDTIALSKHRFV